MTIPRPWKGKSRQGNTSTQPTTPKSQQSTTGPDSISQTEVISDYNEATPTITKTHTWNSNGRSGTTSTQVTGPRSQPSTTSSINHVQDPSYGNSETPGMAMPHTRKTQGRWADKLKQTTVSKPLQPITDSNSYAQVAGYNNAKTPAVETFPTRKAKGRRRQTPNVKSQQPTSNSVNDTQVTNHSNSKTPVQSGSGGGGASISPSESVLPKDADNGWVVTDTGNGWVETKWVGMAGKVYPLPGTIVDLSRPRSEFLEECQLPQKRKPDTWDSRVELTRTVRDFFTASFQEPAADFCLSQTLSSHVPNRRVFNYMRKWASLGDKKPQDVYAMVQERDFLRYLPRVHKETPQHQLLRVEKRYHKANRDDAFKLMKATMHCEPTLLLAPAPTPDVLNTSKSIRAEDGKNPKNKENGLIRLMSIPEVFNKVMDDLKPSVADLTSLAMACKDTAQLISGQFAVWDFGAGNFHTEERYLNGNGGIRMNTLIITSITKAEASIPQDKPFEREFMLLTKMIRTMSFTLTSFRDLILDQIPYLNFDLARLIILSMPNLESVAITRCKLLDFDKLGSLLRVVELKKKLADAGRHKEVRLDFYPYFFEGPTSAPNTFGSFGVTYHKPTFDIPKAVFARIMASWDLAGKLGVDLLSDSSGLWHFIRRLPGPDPFWAYKAREAVLTWDRNRRIPGRGRNAHLWESEVTWSLWTDLGAAVCGDTNDKIPPSLKNTKCSGCDASFPDYLFAEYTKSGSPCCWGCRMGAFIANHEDSHFRDRTNRVVEIWLGNQKKWPVPRLYHLLKDVTEERDAMRVARMTDQAWRNELFEFKPDMPRYHQAIHWKTHLSSTKRTRDLVWPLTGPTDNREGGPQYQNPYLQAGIFDVVDKQANSAVQDFDKGNRLAFCAIYSHDAWRLPDLEPYNLNWEARERAKADWKKKAEAQKYTGGW